MSEDFSLTFGEEEDAPLNMDAEEPSLVDLLASIPTDGLGDDLGFDDEEDYSIGGDGSDSGDDSEGYSIDGSADDGQLSQALLLKSQVDMVQELIPFAQRTSELLAVMSPKAVSEEDLAIKYAISSTEFPYMSPEVFSVFHNILVDLATQEQFQGYDSEACLSFSLQLLNHSARWEPKLNSEEYANSFITWHKRFRKLAGTQGKPDDSDLAGVVDIDELNDAHNVFTLNSRPFVLVNNFFNDTSVPLPDEVMDPRLYGELCVNYMSKKRLSRLTFRHVQDAILDFFGSEDLTNSLKLSYDEILTYTLGELLRRYLLFELNAGIFYPAGLPQVPNSEDPGFGNILYKSAMNGSVSAEIICLLRTLMLVSPKRAMSNLATEFMEDMFAYLLSFMKDSVIVNPVFYRNVVRSDGRYYLDYVEGENSYTIESDDVLCSIVGTKYNLYCCPRIIRDDVRGYAICPDPSLLNSLRSIAKGGRLRVSGGMRFVFTPSVGWLISNKLLAEDKDAKTEVVNTGISGEANTLFQMILSYDNSFTADGAEVPVCMISNDEYNRHIYAVGAPEGQEGYLISAVVAKQDDSSARPIGSNGILVSAEDLFIAQFTGTDGKTTETSFRTATTEIADLSSKAVAEEDLIPLSLFLRNKGPLVEVPYADYSNAVRELCEMATLDYDEELSYVQQVIARDLFYLLGVPRLDGILAGRVLDEYEQLYDKAPLDPFNFSTLQELVDLLVGKPNGLTGLTEWSDTCKECLDKEVKPRLYSLSDACAAFDKLDADVLALQVLSTSQISRIPEMGMYKAIRQMPGLGSRFHLLENKMLVLRVFSQLGDQGITVFDKFTPLARTYNEEITAKTVEAMHYTLKEKMSRRIKLEDKFSLPLVRRVVEEEYSPDTVILKYFILERNVYSLLFTLQSYGDKYKDICAPLLKTLGFQETTQLSKVAQKEFNKHATRDAVERLFTDNSDILYPLLLKGFISETISDGNFTFVRAYDLFNTFYTVLMGQQSKAKIDSDDRDFIEYAGSFVVSYCPVTGAAANMIDGGGDRAATFINNTSDFLYSENLSCLRQLDLQDMRLLVGGDV